MGSDCISSLSLLIFLLITRMYKLGSLKNLIERSAARNKRNTNDDQLSNLNFSSDLAASHFLYYVSYNNKAPFIIIFTLQITILTKKTYHKISENFII